MSQPTIDTELRREAYEERAAIMEYDGGMTREQAEPAARAAWPERRAM